MNNSHNSVILSRNSRVEKMARLKRKANSSE